MKSFFFQSNGLKNYDLQTTINEAVLLDHLISILIIEKSFTVLINFK